MSVWERSGHPSPALAFEDRASLAAPARCSCWLPLLPSAILEPGKPHSRPSI